MHSYKIMFNMKLAFQEHSRKQTALLTATSPKPRLTQLSNQLFIFYISVRDQLQLRKPFSPSKAV